MTYRLPSHEHRYDTGQIILTNFGPATIVGLRIRMRNAVYYVRPHNEPGEKVVFEHEIIGVAISHKQAVEFSNGKGLLNET